MTSPFRRVVRELVRRQEIKNKDEKNRLEEIDRIFKEAFVYPSKKSSYKKVKLPITPKGRE